MSTRVEQTASIRVCYFGTYRAEYSRNQIMIEGLRRAGVEVVECQVQLWKGIDDRVQAASGGWKKPAFWLRLAGTYLRLLLRYRKAGKYDVLVVGYPGQIDVFLARLLAWMRGKPLAWDVFMSIYLISLERGLDKRSPLTIDLLRRFERLACRLPDMLILDTSYYVKWFERNHNINPARFRLVPTGADDRTYRPIPAPPSGNGCFRVLYYGTYIPNHSVKTIVEAAHLLEDEPSIVFELVGEGPEKQMVQELSDQYSLKNITFTHWLEKEELVKRAAQADVCLGAFGETPQSLMTVQNKIYEGLAMRKAVISGDSPAIRENLTHGEHIYLCERRNPSALASAIRTLKSSPELRLKLAEQGHRRFNEKFDLDHLGACYAAHLCSLVMEERGQQ